MKFYKFLLYTLFLIIGIICALILIFDSVFYLNSTNNPALNKYFALIVKELNKRIILTENDYDIYIANFSNSSTPLPPKNNKRKSIIWLGGHSGLALTNLDKFDYVFASTPLLNDFLKANNINSYYVPLGDFEKIDIHKNKDNQLTIGIIGNPVYVKDTLNQRNIKYKQYLKYSENEIIKDVENLDAVFVEDTSYFNQSLDLHPIFFKLAHKKIPIATHWSWPSVEENINMFNDFINFYIEEDDLNILIDELAINHTFIENRVNGLFNLIEKQYSLDSIVNQIEYILKHNKTLSFEEDKTINFDLGVAVGHIGSGDFWLVHDMKNYLINNGYSPSMTFFNSLYKYKTDINIFVTGFLPQNNDKRISDKNILYIAYPMFGNDGKNEFVKNLDEYVNEIANISTNMDAVIVASKFLYNELNKKGIKAHYIPQYTNLDKFYYDYDESLKSDVFFVGVNTFYRRAPNYILEANLPITIYGPNYPDGVSKGEYLDNRILRKHYSSAKIVLNDTREGMIKFGFISNRIFDATACGTLVISDYVKEIEDVYGDSIPMWKTKEELIELVKYYLDPKNEKERLEKAQKAREITLKNFTVDIVGKKFEDVIMRIKNNVY